ncbi:reverse transcriptase domain-containing protein [Tanacetum coccineum]
MPFGLCNAPATFQRCMLAIFHDMIEESVEVFMDDFFVFGNSFEKCLNNLDKILQHCKDAHLVLNWEKCHFMVKEGIVLGHKVSGAGLEVDSKNQYNPAIWSRKLDDALWAFRTAHKTPTGTTPYKLIYGKNCHLSFKIEHRAYWALKNCNPDLIVAGEKRVFQLHELDELRHQGYENSRLYKARTKVWHDKKTKNEKRIQTWKQGYAFSLKVQIQTAKTPILLVRTIRTETSISIRIC